MEFSDYKNLNVWKLSIQLSKDIYLLVKKFPLEERFGLTDQIKRSAVSVPSNIAEGQARNSNKDFIRFLLISKGSLAELETQLIISKELGFIDSNELLCFTTTITSIGKMISSLIKSLEKNKV